jgi:hypothetical protein
MTAIRARTPEGGLGQFDLDHSASVFVVREKHVDVCAVTARELYFEVDRDWVSAA